MDLERKSPWRDLPRRTVLLPPLVLCAVSFIGATGLRPNSPQLKAEAPVLAVNVKSFMIKDADMQDALRALRAEDVSQIVIGFERIPHREGEKEKRISLNLTNTTVGDIIRRLCEADSRYEYDVVKGRLIEVRPKGAAGGAYDLLNIKVHKYSVDQNTLPGAAIEQIKQDAPELRELLRRKELEWIKKTGKYPGYPGSMASGNMTPPRFTLRLEGLTVREILNAIALQSITMFKDGRAYGPTGWEYDFIINPNAATTLGGYPRWTSF